VCLVGITVDIYYLYFMCAIIYDIFYSVAKTGLLRDARLVTVLHMTVEPTQSSTHWMLGAWRWPDSAVDRMRRHYVMLPVPSITLLHIYISLLFSKDEPNLVEQDFSEQHRDAPNISTSNKHARRCESRFVRSVWLDWDQTWSVDLQVLQTVYM